MSKTFQPGGGVHLPTKHSAGINRRIDILVEMDERHKRLLAAGDAEGLRELAGEYRKMFAFDTAGRIEKEAEAV
jgi:hypothetical protein